MRIDDITFSRFVNNDLPQAKMVEVEKILIEHGEINAAVHASMMNYSINKDYADDLLGIDEKNISVKDRITLQDDSEKMNNKSLILKNTTMNNKLSKEEILKVQELAVKFNESYNAELSLEDNLVNFYLEQRPGTFPEDAQAVVTALKSGVTSFNDNLKKALENGDFDYSAELANLASDLSLKEKYEMYINFLAALQTLCVENLSSEQASKLENYHTIRERLLVEEDVTEEMLYEVEEKIGLLLKNNNLCLGNIESLKDLIEELPNGIGAIESVVINSEQDMREKIVLSMSTYIAYQNEEIESLKGQELSPEVIATAVAAGVEEMHLMNELNSGRTTIDKVIMVLKIIGGIALFSLLAYVAFNFVTFFAASCSAMFMLLYGTSTIALIGALLTFAFVAWSLYSTALDAGEKVMSWSSRIFDAVVNTWREIVWPSTFAILYGIGEWFTSLFQKKTVVEEQQNNVEETQQTLC